MAARDNIHATGLVIEGIGVLLRGPTGAGKSILALETLSRNPTAVLVADDRIDLTIEGKNLIMTAPPTISGKIELRGRGIINRPFQTLAQVRLVVDFVEELERFVDAPALITEVNGIRLARCPIPRAGVVDITHQYHLLDAAVAHTKALLADGLKKPLDT